MIRFTITPERFWDLAMMVSKILIFVVNFPHETIFAGTIVYEGSFDDRVVAVKRVSKDLVKEVQREKLILIESDSHPNVIKYFCTEEDSRYFYLALEKCVVNLDQFVLRSDLKTALAPKDVLSQIANGIAHLHKINIGMIYDSI